MKKLLFVMSFFILLSACNGGGGKIPTDSLGIPNVCGCGGVPSYVTNTGDSQGVGGVSQEESDKINK
jgi:hypothetical protein